MITFPPHLPTKTALKKREVHVRNESHYMLSILSGKLSPCPKQRIEVRIPSFDRMFNSSISKKNEFVSQWDPDDKSFTKKIGKSLWKSQNMSKGFASQHSRRLFYYIFNSEYKYIKWLIFSRSLAMKCNATGCPSALCLGSGFRGHLVGIY